MSVVLNFYPYYEELLITRQKFTTIRLGDRLDRFKLGQEVSITLGWSEEQAIPVSKAVITSVKLKKIKEVADDDLVGESPDCKTRQAIKYVLSAIYRKIATDDDYVTIISWKYV